MYTTQPFKQPSKREVIFEELTLNIERRLLAKDSRINPDFLRNTVKEETLKAIQKHDHLTAKHITDLERHIFKIVSSEVNILKNCSITQELPHSLTQALQHNTKRNRRGKSNVVHSSTQRHGLATTT